MPVLGKKDEDFFVGPGGENWQDYDFHLTEPITRYKIITNI